MSNGFHKNCGTSVKIFNNKYAIYNSSAQKDDGYIFSMKPLEKYTKFSFSTWSDKHYNNVNIIVGLTTIDPETIIPGQLPENYHIFADSAQYTDIYNIPNNVIPAYDNEMSVYYTSNGAFIMHNNADNSPFLIGWIEPKQKLWLILKCTKEFKNIEFLDCRTILPNHVTDLYHISHTCRLKDEMCEKSVSPSKYMIIVAATDQGENENTEKSNLILNQPNAGSMLSTPKVAGLGIDCVYPSSPNYGSSIDSSYYSPSPIHIYNNNNNQKDKNLSHAIINLSPLSQKQTYIRNTHCNIPLSFIDNMNSRIMKSSINCVICITNKKEFACYPCGHACLCQDCVNMFKGYGNSCPICRKQIRDIIKIYF
ncbi:Zinc finger, RING-type domain and NEUZ domain and Zinc finger, RING/FYVE/PHD-type domain-containing protein [Strongyloides ratti]|uniref:Zinc finger, RING-type domain and NEUZ domain and Zinc finger, RING/FYVE/PHD-type domain-containing protein n=1 Tax=Strongyloides ratti TaxID=34506 RepID=A0A090MYM1_STRRB|nr:Zinc finger, RING-type domain and NEUZ domain and Zinc finger, RING/FYVE/PHD-type domain-containing protein [Strongyloides ratti]CEF67424.1 Zinc finger, RING-type domain and NEUZ domain and Zinc finger, RING/FYVE/PHD-type domain-containing protein [Strongyloides ratti]